MGEKKDVVGKFLYLEENGEARERTGKKIPDNIVMKAKGKEVKIGLFTTSAVYSQTKKKLDGAEGKEVKVPVYVNGKWLTLNDHEELTFVGEESEPMSDGEEDVDEAAQTEPKVNMSKVSYRNYLVEEFHKAYQDATLVVEELKKNATLTDQATLDIACALFSKLAVAEKEYGKK